MSCNALAFERITKPLQRHKSQGSFFLLRIWYIQNATVYNLRSQERWYITLLARIFSDTDIMQMKKKKKLKYGMRVFFFPSSLNMAFYKVWHFGKRERERFFLLSLHFVHTLFIFESTMRHSWMRSLLFQFLPFIIFAYGVCASARQNYKSSYFSHFACIRWF